MPVYTVWGACEDVSVLEKLRSGEYKVDNLNIIDESHSRLLDIGGVKLRLLGLGGAVVMHKMFDNGEGRTTIAGGQGTMWTTLLQIGELIDTANRVYDPTETRLLVTHSSPAREGILNQLAVTLKVDFSISAGLHFRYGSSYNEFSVNPSLDHYRGKLSASKAQFHDVWETVKHEVEPAVAENDAQNKLLQHALELVKKMPSTASGGNPFGGGVPNPNGQIDESAFKNMWNFNLADAAFGWLVLDVDQGRIGTEMRAQGFNFAHRGGKSAQRPQAAQSAPSTSTMLPAGGNVPAPGQQPAQPAQQQVSRSQGPAAAQQPPAQPRSQQPAPQAQPQQQKPALQQQPAQQAAPKSSTPQPSAALTSNGVTAPTATLPQTNGTGASTTDASKPDTPVQARNNVQQSPGAQEPSKAIFISGTFGLNTEEDFRSLFTPEDATKITSLERTNRGPWLAHFETHDIAREVLTRTPTKEAREKYNQLRMSMYKAGPPRSYGAGWGSTRGGVAPRGGADAGRGGYQSTGGGTTGSDSETNRGGRGGRGGFRGDRGGRGRGGRGRGGERGGKTDGASAPTTAPATTGADS